MYLHTRLPETETREQSPFTLDALIAWLRTKNPEETYCYSHSGVCLAAQFNALCGRQYCLIAFAHLITPEYHRGERFDVTLERIARTQAHTFSAALSRATAIRGV